eukprot:3229943-Pleurochrysis_carterae.AAC.1
MLRLILHPSRDDAELCVSFLHPSRGDAELCVSFYTLRDTRAHSRAGMATAATADKTMAVTGQELKRPNYKELQGLLTSAISSKHIESLSIGSFAPIFARDTLQQPWLPCVLLRKAEKECLIFDREGVKQVASIPCGFDDVGNPVDDG